MNDNAIKNNELLKKISADLNSISKDIITIKEQISELNFKLTKINNVEEKIQKGENIKTNNGGWFYWS